MPVIVSQTWSRHWKVTLDGSPVVVRDHENLVLISLPAGEHAVDFHYDATPVQAVGRGVTGTGVLLAVVASAVCRRPAKDRL
jgi:hypothetical protein